MPVPSFKDLMNPTLDAIRETGGSASIGEITDRVSRNLKLSDDVTNQLHGGGPGSELEYQLAWARTYLKKQGLINNSTRGIWALTPQGAETPQVVPNDVVRKVLQDRHSYHSSAQVNGEDVESVGDDQENWREQLIATLRDMQPDAFERLCQRMLRESGFIEVTVTGRSGDGGIDGHGIIRMGGLISFPVLFQCKRFTGSVTPNLVRDFRGAMAGRSDKGLLITTGSFTRDAKQEATREGVPPIDLIDGNLLAEKLKELGLGVKTETVVTIDAEWFNTI